MSKLLSGGRLKSVRKDISLFTSSIKDDLVLSNAVININRAHVMMLMEEKIIDQFTGVSLLKALTSLLETSFTPSIEENEDIHMAVEEAVLQKTDEETGGNLHIAKSRNDQISTAIRIHLRILLLNSMNNILKLQKNLLDTAEQHLETIILQYTHLQPAQPVTFAHYLLSFSDNLERSFQRFIEVYKRINVCPLGAGALATTSFKINRAMVSDLLGFDDILENSIDAVSSRDFILETLSIFTLLSVTISRLAEDLIIFSSMDFNVIELPDEFVSTSSIMPQKKNPEPLEIIRANASRVLGDFVSSVSTVKGLPSTYNLDFQQITPNLWNSIENVNASLYVLSEILPKLKIANVSSDKAQNSFVAATEIANFLTREYHIPFRTAHKIVGALVRSLIANNLTLNDLTSEMIQNISKNITKSKIKISNKQISDITNLQKIINSYNVKGGPAPKEVKRALIQRNKHITNNQNSLSILQQKLLSAQQKMESKISYFLSQNQSNIKFKNSKL